jgi:hypothetical protein
LAQSAMPLSRFHIGLLAMNSAEQLEARADRE